MSGIVTFFRHCPSCGRRFEIRLVKKELEKENSRVIVPNSPRAWGSRGGTAGIELREDEPLLIDVKEFNYSYRCGHCGHEWSEIHRKEKTKSAPDDYPKEWRTE
jgi:DNA-directed RNA polymerase subunit RPC12/RpoP